MSFASETKKELCKIEPQECCLKAETYGLLLFSRSFSEKSISFTTENKTVLQKASQLTAQCTGSIVDIRTTLSYRKKMQGKEYPGVFTLVVPDENDRARILRNFGHRENGMYLHRENIENECCIASFLRGAFLACGTVTDPSRDYHLEFSSPCHALAQDLALLLSQCGELKLESGIIYRKGFFVVYLKGSENIADLLAYIGAQNSAMELMQAKMVKEVRNYVNRTTNFQTANITKTATAAALQLEAIQKIDQNIGIKSLPEELQELAALRLENPEMSLRELGESLSEPISRSGINHRLTRILDIAKKL